MTFWKIIIKGPGGVGGFVGWCNFEPSESFCSSRSLQGQEQTFTFFPSLHQPVYPSQLSSTEFKQSVKETKIKTSFLNWAQLNFKLHVVQKPHQCQENNYKTNQCIRCFSFWCLRCKCGPTVILRGQCNY